MPAETLLMSSNNRVLFVMLAIGCLILVAFQLEAFSTMDFTTTVSYVKGSIGVWKHYNEEPILVLDEPDELDFRLIFDESGVPQTQIIAHTPGWTIFDKLYVMDGTAYIVTDEPSSIPAISMMISTGIPLELGNANFKDLEPTDKEMRIVSTKVARELFGAGASKITGVTFLANEPVQFINHMYHFAAELLFGLWRTYSSLDPDISTNGHTKLPAPRRIIFPHVSAIEWRDYAAMNQYILRAAFPSVTLEFEDTWKERAEMKGAVFAYDHVVFGDRGAAMRGEEFIVTQRIAAQAFTLGGSSHWWSTIRNAVVEFAGLLQSDLEGPPVITYVSRQNWGRRMLRDTDHKKLVVGLDALKKKYGYEINIVDLDKMTRSEQIRLLARTTILLGVHGNGLTGLLWMTPSVQTTVIEFFFPGGFAHDYEWTTRALGMTHFGVWNNETFTYPQLPPYAYPEGFQGNNIPLDADIVIKLIESRMSL